MTMDSSKTVVTRDMERVFGGLSGSARFPAERRSALPAHPGWRRGAKVAGSALLIPVGAAIWLAAPLLRPIESRTPDRAQQRPVPIRPSPSATIVPPPAPLGSAPSPAAAKPRLAAAPAPAPQAGRGSPDATVRDPAAVRSPSAQVRLGVAANTEPAPAAPLGQGARDRDGCLYREIDGADRRLEAAYDRAVDSPLTVSELAAVRRSWSAALSRSREEPSASIRALDSLATRLYNDIAAASREPAHDDR